MEGARRNFTGQPPKAPGAKRLNGNIWRPTQGCLPSRVYLHNIDAGSMERSLVLMPLPETGVPDHLNPLLSVVHRRRSGGSSPIGLRYSSTRPLPQQNREAKETAPSPPRPRSDTWCLFTVANRSHRREEGSGKTAVHRTLVCSPTRSSAIGHACLGLGHGIHPATTPSTTFPLTTMASPITVVRDTSRLRPFKNAPPSFTAWYSSLVKGL